VAGTCGDKGNDMSNKSVYLSESEKIDILFFKILFYFSLITGFGAAAYSYYETKNHTAFLVHLFSLVPMVFLGLRTFRKKKFLQGYFSVTLCIIFLVLPAGFLGFGGSNSGMPIYFTLIAIVCGLCRNRMYRIISIIALAIVVTVLFIIENSYPQLITPFDQRTARIDTLFAIVTCSSVGFFYLMNLMNKYTELNNARLKALEYKNQMYTEMLSAESERMDFLRRFRHDVHHKNAVLAELIGNGHYEKALLCLEEFDREDMTGFNTAFCMNLTLNSILNYMNRLCRAKNIAFEVSADVTEQIPVNSNDLCIIVSNLLENAINGAEESGKNEKSIVFHAVTRGERLVFTCNNTCSSEVTVHKGMITGSSTGIMSIQEAIKKYDGTIEYRKPEDQMISCTVLLNLAEKSPAEGSVKE